MVLVVVFVDFIVLDVNLMVDFAVVLMSEIDVVSEIVLFSKSFAVREWQNIGSSSRVGIGNAMVTSADRPIHRRDPYRFRYRRQYWW